MIPVTVQDSLLARINRLTESEAVARIGAAIGREFSFELLAAVVPSKSKELEAALLLQAAPEHRARQSAAGDLYVQARLGAGGGLFDIADQPSPDAPQTHRRDLAENVCPDNGAQAECATVRIANRDQPGPGLAGCRTNR